MEDILGIAIQSVQNSSLAYCKFLSPNDTKATKAHQSGYLISRSAWSLFLDAPPTTEHIIKESHGKIWWQDSFATPVIFTYYKSKGEFRLTGFGRGFPFREEENVGDLFILCKKGKDDFEGFVLSSDEDIDEFLAAFNISSNDTNKLIPRQFEQNAEDRLLGCFKIFLESLKMDFPPTIELANGARNCYNNSYSITSEIIRKDPDAKLLNWIDAEFQLFKVIENDRYTHRILTKFESVEQLVNTANTILNRRKSRAGKSLEHHLAEIFNNFDLKYSSQSKTEGNKKPDFLFPNEESYKNSKFEESKLIMLASKTTCKDRWRQILNEADRIKTKHLFTLQQGISSNQLNEMYDHNVCLVVPSPYLGTFPENFQQKILTLKSFIHLAKNTQS